MAEKGNLAAQDVITHGEEQVYTVVDGEAVLMSVANGKYYKLDDIGTRIWALIETPTAVSALCDKYQVSCQMSLEENMPCGVGVCNGCVVPVTGAGDDYGRYRRICVEGPVLWAHEIDWGRFTGGSSP